MKKLQPMAADDQAILKMSLEGEVGTTVFSIKENADGLRCNLTWHFNFADVTIEELRLVAMRAWKIDKATEWRGAKDRMNADVWQNRTFSGRSILDQTRSKATPAQQMDKIAPKMTKAERQAAIKLLQAFDEEVSDETGPLMVGKGYSGSKK